MRYPVFLIVNLQIFSDQNEVYFCCFPNDFCWGICSRTRWSLQILRIWSWSVLFSFAVWKGKAFPNCYFTQASLSSIWTTSKVWSCSWRILGRNQFNHLQRKSGTLCLQWSFRSQLHRCDFTNQQVKSIS